METYTPEEMQLAIIEVKDEGKTVLKAAKKYNIPYESLRHLISRYLNVFFTIIHDKNRFHTNEI